MGGEITDLELTKRYRARMAARGLSAQSYYQDPEDGKKKRVGKACDSCRNKKTKCDGRKPCSKCSQDNKICVYSEKKKLQEKTYSSSYVELLECRIQILQDSLYKIISKIGNSEPVDHYVPHDDDYSINHIIDLVMREDEQQDSEITNNNINEEESPASSTGVVLPTAQQSSSEAESPDQAPLQLDLGPYKSGAAMAAAAAAGNPITLPNSPTSTIASSPESSSDLYFSNFTPPDSISPQLLDGNNKSSSFTSLSTSAPHKLGRRGSAGHLSKVHKAGSHYHQHPTLTNSGPYNRPNRHSMTASTAYNDEYDNDYDLMNMQSSLGNLVKMEEINVNLDDLWLGVPPN
jgi:hypothetical protein